MKRIHRILCHAVTVVILLILMSAFLLTKGVFAYTTPEYKVDVDVQDNYVFRYTETITVDYGEKRQHGIYRNIPMDENYRIKNVTVDGYEYDIDRDSGNLVIRIGSEDRTVTGIQKYVIHYELRGVKDQDRDADYLYLDVLPTGWSSAIDRASVEVRLPEDLTWGTIDCYTGRYGSEVSTDGEWKISEEDHLIRYSGSNLAVGVGATIYAVLPEGYWKDPISMDWTRYGAVLISVIGIIMLVFLRVTFGRNPKVIAPVEFYPPEGLTPLEVGYVIDGVADQSDITSMLFYLADKGYLSIREYSKNKFEFIRTGNMTGESPATRRLFKGLFGSTAFDDIESVKPKKLTVRSNAIGSRLSNAYRAIPALVDQEYSDDRKIFTASSRIADRFAKGFFFAAEVLCLLLAYLYHGAFERGDLLYALIVSLWFGAISLLLIVLMCNAYYYRISRKGPKTVLRLTLLGILYALHSVLYLYVTVFSAEGGLSYPYLDAAMTVLIAAAPFLIVGMRSRSEWSANLYGRVLGFRNFIKTAELDRIEMLVEESPDYFFHILPYAYVLGLTKKWASKFEHIAVEPPEWYAPMTGNRREYNILTMHSMLDHVSHNVTESIHSAVRSSSDKGSGGGSFFSGGGGGGSSGGFSGGGFGGGGGGTW